MEHGLDEKALRRELETAVEADQRRKDVDEMKKRSIMTARTYSEFRNLVACAQDGQKPVSHKEMDFIGNPGRPEGFMYSHLRKSDWKSKFKSSSAARGLLERHNGKSAPGNSSLNRAEPTKTPGCEQDFERFMRRKDIMDKQRCEILLDMDLAKVFSVGVNDLGGLLSCFASILEEGESDSGSSGTAALDRAKLCEFLVKLSQVPRFDLAVDFLGKREREIVSKVVTFAQIGANQIDLVALFKLSPPS